MRMPPDSPKQGAPSLRFVGKTLRLHRGSDKVPLTEFSRNTGSPLNNFYIEFNFSERRAQLKSRLATTFATQVPSLWVEATAQRMASPQLCREGAKEVGTGQKRAATTRKSTPKRRRVGNGVSPHTRGCRAGAGCGRPQQARRTRAGCGCGRRGGDGDARRPRPLDARPTLVWAPPRLRCANQVAPGLVRPVRPEQTAPGLVRPVRLLVAMPSSLS